MASSYTFLLTAHHGPHNKAANSYIPKSHKSSLPFDFAKPSWNHHYQDSATPSMAHQQLLPPKNRQYRSGQIPRTRSTSPCLFTRCSPASEMEPFPAFENDGWAEWQDDSENEAAEDDFAEHCRAHCKNYVCKRITCRDARKGVKPDCTCENDVGARKSEAGDAKDAFGSGKEEK
ncbi:hypothetical protein EJ02DRAFT_470149 [Clathrospora elynae]|uniref:Uncharacterized protein n=1 Tax=Clathrospora elynae TaxID=706981 RepID=A0A6A5S9Z0_9PLEO|nr:hypothetical protein EJ02DRAFT_470149 [Clathrospora elynae]